MFKLEFETESDALTHVPHRRHDMSATKPLQWFADPGHAWLRVPRAELAHYGIAHEISMYSYQRGDYVYLEEDCDASVYLKAAGVSVRSVPEQHTDNDSAIRRYDRYLPPPTPEQEEALWEFAKEHGERWKRELKLQWLDAAAPPLLHQLRNSHGPAWLASYTLP